MNSNGQNFKLTSGNSLFYYGSYEYCYWGVYAPGAQKLRFELLDDLEVSEIFLYIIDFAGRINKSSLHFDQIGSYKNCLKFQTDSGSDYLNVHLGVGTGGYLALQFYNFHSKYCCWEYEAEIMFVRWHTDHKYGDWGFKARITRIG